MIKLISWNINGFRSIIKKSFWEFIDAYQPNVLCLQETKLSQYQIDPQYTHYKNYISYWNSAQDKKGYSGTAIYLNIAPINLVKFDINDTLNQEGRTILLEFQNFWLLNVYFPNGKQSKERLAFKLNFYERFLEKILKLEETKPVIFCGDVNTAHKEIDLARPKENANVSGFLPIEREWIDKVISSGYIDAFRKFNNKPHQYTWWDYKTKARERNIGWRIDYFFVSRQLEEKIINSYHLTEVSGSDHCPIVLELNFDYPTLQSSPLINTLS